MPKEKEKDMRRNAEEKLSDAELEQAAGGKIEISQDGPENSAGEYIKPKNVLRGDHMA